MRENNCDSDPDTCPRPIVIAAAGGASRAGFFTASIIGYLIDQAQSHGLDPNKVRNRLFAISSVSGSSMGAVMATAALNATVDSNFAPCVKSPVSLWWGIAIRNWRDCLEGLTSGDFLTPVMIGLTFRDSLSFLLQLDRAALLEDSWSGRYRSLVTRADAVQDRDIRVCIDLDCPFLSLRPRSGHWIPLLILNGTSEKTGGRIVTTPLATTYAGNAFCRTPCKVFPGSMDFYDLLGVGRQGDSSKDILNDVRISTAALNSARFPIISPPGAIRNQDGIVDRIVDGGYFDNYGLVSATDLVVALHALDPRLAPAVVVITNDPSDALLSTDDVVSAPQPTHLSEAVKEFLPDVTAPIATILNNQILRGAITYEQSTATLRNAKPSCRRHIIHVGVWHNPISLSWWLSTLDQLYLHEETEGTRNGNLNGPHLDAIWSLMKLTSSCSD